MNARFLFYIFISLIVFSGGIFMAYQISQSGINKIKKHEALRLEPYRDSAGLWTIGWGHLLKQGEWWDSITEEFAEDLLRKDLAAAERAVNKYVLVPISQNQYDALVSFVFNVGIGALQESTTLRKLNAGDYDGAADALLLWNKVTVNGVKKISNGLIARREHERSLFLA